MSPVLCRASLRELTRSIWEKKSVSDYEMPGASSHISLGGSPEYPSFGRVSEEPCQVQVQVQVQVRKRDRNSLLKKTDYLKY